MSNTDRKIRVLVAKPGLDGHDRGAKVIASSFRDAGFEVIYTGLHQTPEMIVAAAVQEDVDVVAMSVLSGAHMTLFPRVKALLEEAGADGVLLTGGGIIPEEDMVELEEQGVGEAVRPRDSDHRRDRLHPDLVREPGGRLMAKQAAEAKKGRLATLSDELTELRARLREGGGKKRIAKQHEQGKLTARERIDLLLDEGEPWVEIGMLVAYDQYDGQAPGAGVVTGVGRVEGREVVVVANDATVKAGSWWPETITKILRAQEVAMRCRIPIIYLVDSAGVNLPYQGGVFPGQYGAARIFYYNSIMRRYLKIPQLAAVMGPCIAGGAYLPALSDVILMVEGTSFMGLGGPNLVKGATGQVVGSEELGGARVHTELSGVAHYMVENDQACIAAPPAPRRRAARGAGLPRARGHPADTSRLSSCTTSFPRTTARPTTSTRCWSASSTATASTSSSPSTPRK